MDARGILARTQRFPAASLRSRSRVPATRVPKYRRLRQIQLMWRRTWRLTPIHDLVPPFKRHWLSKEISLPASRVATSVAFKGEAKPRSEREIIEAALADTRGRVSGPSGAAAKLRIPPFLSTQRVSHRGACRQCPPDFRIAYKSSEHHDARFRKFFRDRAGPSVS